MISFIYTNFKNSENYFMPIVDIIIELVTVVALGKVVLAGKR